MASNADRGTLLGKAANRIDNVWAEDANEPTDPRIKTLVHLMRDGASEEVRKLAETELLNMGYGGCEGDRADLVDVEGQP